MMFLPSIFILDENTHPKFILVELYIDAPTIQEPTFNDPPAQLSLVGGQVFGEAFKQDSSKLRELATQVNIALFPTVETGVKGKEGARDEIVNYAIVAFSV